MAGPERIMAEGTPSPEGGSSPDISSSAQAPPGPEAAVSPWKKLKDYQATLDPATGEMVYKNPAGEEIVRIRNKDVVANALLPEKERLEAAEKLLGPLSVEQREALKEMHKMGEGEKGKDEQAPAGVYNYKVGQLLRKARIGAEKTKTGEAVFSKEQRRSLMESGLAGFLPLSEIVIDPNNYPATSPLRAVAEEIQDTGADGEANEGFFNGIIDRIKKLIDAGATTYTEARNLIKNVKGWRDAAIEVPVPLGDSDFEKARTIYAWYESRERKRALTPAETAEKTAKKSEMDTLVGEAERKGVLAYFYQDVSTLYKEITSESVSSYGEGESRRTTENRIETARRVLNNYQETFWDYGEEILKKLFNVASAAEIQTLRVKYEGVASYIASKAAVAIEKNLNGIVLSTTEIGDKEIRALAEETEKKQKENRKRNPLWDRSWGRIILTGTSPEEITEGIDNFLKVATDEQSNYDANRNIQDSDQLNQEIQRRGQQVGMAREKILEEVARAEGTLLISVADHFAVRWHVPEWHQVAMLIAKQIDTRLNAVSKAYDAEVIHAADLLDNDEEYSQYSQQARYASEKSAENDQVASSKREETRRKLEVRIAMSELKNIDTVIREHFVGIETQIDSYGFDRSAVSATELFNNPLYLEAIKSIDDKLKALNQKYVHGQTITPADKLTDVENKLLALDRIRSYEKTADLVVTDQTDEQFRNLYKEGWADFETKIKNIKATMGDPKYDQRLKQLIDGSMNAQYPESDEDQNILLDGLLKKYIEKKDLLKEESVFIKAVLPNWDKVEQAVGLAIKTREVFFISAEKACTSLKTRHDIAGEGEGELLSYNDVVRLNKFVRERAIASLPAGVAMVITGPRIKSALKEHASIVQSYEDPEKVKKDYSGLMYVDIADKLEFRNLSDKVINKKGEGSEFGKNAKEAKRLITLTSEEEPYRVYVQAVEYVQEKVLEKLKEQGSALTVVKIDGIIQQVFQEKDIDFNTGQNARNEQLQSVHRGETQRRSSVSINQHSDYQDIVSRENADPQYNFSMFDDQKYGSLLLSDEIKAAAYNPDHPYYLSIPATVRRVLDPDGTKLVRKADPEVERADAFRVQETQRRFHFAVDSVKVFGAFYRPDLYIPESEKPTNAEMVRNIRNAPFIGRRMIEQRAWTLWNRGQAYRGRGFLKYLESNFRGLDHSTGVRGLRGVIASYNGFSNPKGFDYKVNFSGVLDELAAELWLGRAKAADEVRPVLVGGQVGQDPNFEGLLKKIIKTIGRNFFGRSQTGSSSSMPPLWLIAKGIWNQLDKGDYEKAIDEIEDRYKRITIYGNSLGFVGNINQAPLAAKFSGDTAARRMVYWSVAHPEAMQVYRNSMDLVRAILQPLKAQDKKTPDDYFGEGKTLFDELLRRAFLSK